MAEIRLSDLSRDVIKAPKGTVLMREGEVGKSAFLVLEGRLLVERQIDGESVIIGEILPRDLVGEVAILDNEPRSATVTAIEDTLLIEFDKHRIKSIIRRSPDIAEVILKLLSHKLRTTHFVIARSSNLSQPQCWLKIMSVLKLCAKAESNPQLLYRLFCENLQLLADIPPHRVRLVLDRLQETLLIESSGQQISSVNKNRLEAFYLRCHEEFANEVFHFSSSAKQYQAMEVIRFYIKPAGPKTEWTDVPRKYLVEMLVNSDLWQYLGTQYQNQRADILINNMIKLGIMQESIIKADHIRILFANLHNMEKPEDSIRNFDMISRILFQAVPDQ
jgi:CRP-like cAMP-binding protein